MGYDIWQSCFLVPGFSRSECASWVQAIGSIAAIYGGLYTARVMFAKEAGRQAREERRRKAVKIEAVLGLVLQAKGLVKLALSSFDPYDQAAWDTFRTEEPELVRKLDAIPMFEMPSARVGSVASTVGGLFRNFRRAAPAINCVLTPEQAHAYVPSWQDFHLTLSKYADWLVALRDEQRADGEGESSRSEKLFDEIQAHVNAVRDRTQPAHGKAVQA